MRGSSKQAFTLVELSIVLVIIGLLVGGVLAGQSLIRAAQLRAITSEYDRYIAAVHAFHDKYSALPGDMPNASSFWPGAPNGNGDAAFGYQGSYTDGASFWKHLELAGLVEGSLTGVVDADNAYTVGSNIPASKLSPGGWSVFTLSNPAPAFPGSCEMLQTDYGNTMAFGAYRQGWWAMNPVINPQEAWNIDTKMDDGNPATGKVIGAQYNSCMTGVFTNCAGTPAQATGYALTTATASCALTFRNSF